MRGVFFRAFKLGLLVSLVVGPQAFSGPKPPKKPQGPPSVVQGSDIDRENGVYPVHPRDEMTDGDLCSKADALRYPERIKYCERNVQTETKKKIIEKYDQVYGYKVGSMDRNDFKIDHLIPLCMGGSNEIRNLWPQHKSVYELTDPLEPELCERMAQGKILQEEAVALILRAKHRLKEVPKILAQVRAMK